MHSDTATLDRVEIIRDLRQGKIDVLVGINLLREGLDIPEVSLVAILDADKEGFLRNRRSLIQTMGRAARNVSGEVVMEMPWSRRSSKTSRAECPQERITQDVATRSSRGAPFASRVSRVTERTAPSVTPMSVSLQRQRTSPPASSIMQMSEGVGVARGPRQLVLDQNDPQRNGSDVRACLGLAAGGNPMLSPNRESMVLQAPSRTVPLRSSYIRPVSLQVSRPCSLCRSHPHLSHRRTWIDDAHVFIEKQ